MDKILIRTLKPIKLISTLLILSNLIYGCSRENSNDDDLTKAYKPTETEITLNTETATIYGSLKLPNANGQFPIVLIIAGSGPTDRNGNNTMGLNTNCYKMISDTLAMHGIASLRYDKRGIAKSYYSGFNEAELRFDDYVNDAKQWIELMKSDDRYTEIFMFGHSEGALIGAIVANQTPLDGFISVSGTTQRADSLLWEQLSAQPDHIKTEARKILDSLSQGDTVSTVSQVLYSLFRLSVQPYLISWFKYSPRMEIAKISSPLIILHGKTDLQVKYTEAQMLAASNSNAELMVIDSMNHVLKNASSDYQENMATYSNPDLPLSDTFCAYLIGFIEQHLLE